MLASYLGCHSYPEDVKAIPEFWEWERRPSEASLLAAQAAFLRHASDRQLKAHDYGGVLERYLDDNFEVFVALYRRHRLLGQRSLRVLTQLYGDLKARTPAPHVVVCLEAPLDTILTRCAERNRLDDQHQDPAILVDIWKLYHDFARQPKMPAPILCDASLPATDVHSLILSALEMAG